MAIQIISRYLKAFLTGASSKMTGVAEIDEFAILRLPYQITSALIAHYDHTLFWISGGTNMDALE